MKKKRQLPIKIIKERRAPFIADQEKFSTQRNVTYVLLFIFIAVAAMVFRENDQSERSMLLQTIINLTLLAVGYWLGASKQGQEQAQSMSRIAEAAPTVAADVVKSAKADAVKTEDVKIDAANADIKIDTKPKKGKS